jgi:transcriptional regulator with XRE-family HTH domain
MPAFGEVVAQLRGERGWTQAELAKRAGYTFKSAISGIESDPERRPQATTRARIAEAFGMSLRELDRLWRPNNLPDARSGENRLPILGPISAGGPFLAYNDSSSWHRDAPNYEDRGNVLDPLAYGMTIDGDSMEPHFRQGDIVVFTPLGVPGRENDDVLAATDGTPVHVVFSPDSNYPDEAGLYVFYPNPNEGTVTLAKFNPKYDRVTVPREHIIHMGAYHSLRTTRRTWES